MSTLTRCLSSAMFACAGLAVLDASHAEPPPGPAAEPNRAAANRDAADPAKPPVAEVRQLITQLNDDKFAARQAASRQLEALGAAVIADLVQAARGHHLEVTTRALDLLRRFLHGPDPPTQMAARQALQQLAASDHQAAAGGARKILEEDLAEAAPQRGPAMPLGQIQIPLRALPGQRRAQIQLQIQGGFGGGNGPNQVQVRQVQLRHEPGRRTIQVAENGREVKIVEDRQGGIQMEVSEGAGDQRKTRKYAARDAGELKKQHPEAHQLYAQYSQLNGLFWRKPQPGQADEEAPAKEAQQREGVPPGLQELIDQIEGLQEQP